MSSPTAAESISLTRLLRSHTFRVSLILLHGLALAILLEYLVKPQIAEGRSRELISAISVALLTAVFLGFTFEVLLNSIRERTFDKLFERQRNKIFRHVDSLTLFSVEDVFGLLESIARQTSQLPTLYRKPRAPAEFTFADSMEYLESLVESRKSAAVDILRSWVRPDSHPHVKFLASDFIGYFRLHRLAQELLDQSMLALPSLEDPRRPPDRIKADEAWILNYVWAASRCSRPRYRELGKLLFQTASEPIQTWILFVPRQMPSEQFFPILDRYLAREKPISGENLFHVIVSLSYLTRRFEGSNLEMEARRILEAHEARLDVDCRRAVEEAWQNLDPRTMPRLRPG